MKKYQYLASWDDQTLTRVGEPVVVLGDSNVSQVEVTLPSNFLLDPTKAECRMYFLLPGEKESDHDVLEAATKDENGDSHVTWTIKHVHSQKGGRLAFSLTLIGDDAQWDSRTAIIPVYESRYQPESEEAEEPYTGRLDALEGSMAAIRGEFAEMQDDFEELKETATLGTPIPESLVANMTEGHVYIYTGTEPGYTASHVYYYVDGALKDGGVYGGTAVDATLTQSGKAADAKVTGDKIEEIKEDLEELSGAGGDSVVDRYIEFNPDYTTEEGYYYKFGDDMVKRSANSKVASVVVTDKIYTKPGYVYSYTGACSNSVPGAFYFSGDTCISTAAITGTNKKYTVPDGADTVIFQSYAASGSTPTLTVEFVSPVILADIMGKRSGDTGQIWTKTADGAEWADNPDARTKEDVEMLRKIATLNMNGFSYSLYEGGGHYNKSGKLAWLNFTNANSYFTELIPCYAGQQFLMMGNVTGGDAFKKVFFIDQDKETIIGSPSTSGGLAIYTIPEGVSYVAFQSSWVPTASIPTFYVEEYSIVRDYRNIRPLDGVKMTILGDSISMPSMSDYISYADMLKNDGVDVSNLAVSGTGIAVGYGSATNYYGRLSKIPSDTEFIVVSGSFNDLNRGPRLGTIDDEGTTTIAGYMNQLFSALLESFPTVPMLIITTHPWSYYKPGTEKSDAYVDMLRQMGLKYGIPFYSLYDKTNLRPWIDACNTKFFRNGGDGVHPNTYGHAQLYALLRPVFIKICYQTSNFLVPGKTPVGLST